MEKCSKWRQWSSQSLFHLSSGSWPGKKEKNLKTVRCYLQYLTISNSDLLVHRKSNPFHPKFETIPITQNLLCGLINALHIKLKHPSKTQFKKVWHRYFFALDADKLNAPSFAIYAIPWNKSQMNYSNNPPPKFQKYWENNFLQIF